MQTATPFVASPLSSAYQSEWPLWRKLLFRFTFIYVVLYMSPAQWVAEVPLISYLAGWYAEGESWVVNLANKHLFHVKDQLVPLNGSGDTSYGYAQLCLFALLAVIGMVIWTLMDRRKNYDRLAYWFLVAVRYYVAMVAFLYGIIKLFGLQMVFPSISQLATPLGDLLPMRFSWLFIGYSDSYQFFSGAAETLVGLLLLWRRTATLGAFVGASVFMNVMVLNLCYDIPVKLFSIHIFAFCNLLLLADAPRLLDFFVFNRPTHPKTAYELTDRRARIGRLVLKTVFIGMFAIWPFYNNLQNESLPNEATKTPKLKAGFYEITDFQANPTLPDSLRWQNVVFEEGTFGSIATTDTLFRQRYRRGYFGYTLDSTGRNLGIKKFASDSLPLFTFQVTRPDTNRLVLAGIYRGDSLRVALRHTNRHFQLAERQFHWLSEANR